MCSKCKTWRRIESNQCNNCGHLPKRRLFYSEYRERMAYRRDVFVRRRAGEKDAGKGMKDADTVHKFKV